MAQQDWSARGFAKHGYRSVARNPGILAKQSVPWLVFLILAGSLMIGGVVASGSPQLIRGFIGVSVQAAFESGIALAWYRLVLLNERSSWSALIPGKRGLYFFAWALLAQTATQVVFLADVVPDDVIAHRNLNFVALLISFVALYYILRISLGFPLIAIDAPKPIATAWRLSKGDVWLFFRVAVLTYLPFQWSGALLLKTADLVPLGAGLVLALAVIILTVVGPCVTAGAFAELMRAKVQPGGLEPPLFWDR